MTSLLARPSQLLATLVAVGLALWPFLSRADGRGAGPALPAQLRQTGLYQEGSSSRVRPDNLPFSPQYPLWSDGAEKRRWIHIPAGRFIDAAAPDAWVFPPGTRLWKEFRFGQRVETRMIERLADGAWRYASYVWNADGSDATLAPERGVRAAGEVRPGVPHDVPGRGDCRICHERPGRPSPVLGFTALQLSTDRDALAPNAEPVPAGAVDLRSLVERRLVRGLPRPLIDRPPRIEAATPVARAALGYLHANCSPCHNGTTQLAAVDLQFEQRLGEAESDVGPLQSAVGRPSAFRPAGAAGDVFRIVPGQPAASTVMVRLRSREPAVQMPPFGTRLVDPAAIALIERWIKEIPTAAIH